MIDSISSLEALDMEAIARAIEADAGGALEGLRESLQDARAGRFAAVHTPEHIAARRRGRPVGSRAATRKVSTTIRLDEDVMGAFRQSGAGWQTRMNAVLREAVEAGRV